MQPPCELRIIRISWAREDVSTDVETAQHPIRLEQDELGWVAEVPAYPKVGGGVYGQLAVALVDGAVDPYLLLANDEPFRLTLVTAPDGREWWVEKGKWKKAKQAQYHDAPLCRHVGEARLCVGSETIRLRIAPTGFAGEAFDALLEEFRNGAWKLILDPLSPTRATDRRGDGGIDPAFLDAVAEFIRYAGRALDQPHRELREIRELQRLERVRPNVGTFRELAIRGLPRSVIGRGHAPSFNTPDNRQLLWMCSRLRRILNGLSAGAQASIRDLLGRAQAAQERAIHLHESLGKVRVDEARLSRLIEEREDQLIAYRRAVKELLSEPPPNTQLYFFHVHQPKVDADRGPAGFWIDGQTADGDAARFRLNFHADRKTLASVFDKRYSYRLTGAFDYEYGGKTNGRQWHVWRISLLTEISPIQKQDRSLEEDLLSEIDYLTERRSSLRGTDFWMPLNKADTEEQHRDLTEALASAERLRLSSEFWAQVAGQLAPLAAQLSSLENRAQGMGIKRMRQGDLSGSMTWVLNPNYRGASGAYRKAKARANLRSSEIEGLLRLEELGILDLPMVYERWCLLRLIAVIRDHFHLVPPQDLGEQLLACVTDEGKVNETVSFRFEGASLERDLILCYQPRLPREGRTEKQRPNPDFMLTVVDHGGGNASAGLNPHPQLVLDAKCIPYGAFGDQGDGFSLIEELDRLIGKGYSSPGDHRVFVLHPGSGPAALERVQDYCHLGGSHLVPNSDERKSWDQDPPDHRYGAVLLGPGILDPLIRLILMHLYLGLEDSLGAYLNRSPAYPRICPACGGSNFTNAPPAGTSEPRHSSPRAEWCSNCGRMVVWNFSGGCGTHLFKLGGHWTFHETHPLNPYDIRCPHCGDYMSIPETVPEPDRFDEELD
jgi:pyrethroid hydrolase